MTAIQFKTHSLETAAEARGIVVVIDVLRAFTTAAYAFSLGAKEIRCVSTVDEALKLKAATPNSLVMGEIDGYHIPEFDLNNSPTRLHEVGLSGKTLIQRTTAGTQGLTLARNAERLIAASLVTATATAGYIRSLQPKTVHFIATGITSDGRGDEDVCCAEILRALILGETIPTVPEISARIRASKNGRRFTDPESADFPASDLDLVLAFDRFDFCLPAEREKDGSVRLSIGKEPPA